MRHFFRFCYVASLEWLCHWGPVVNHIPREQHAANLYDRRSAVFAGTAFQPSFGSSVAAGRETRFPHYPLAWSG